MKRILYTVLALLVGAGSASPTPSPITGATPGTRQFADPFTGVGVRLGQAAGRRHFRLRSGSRPMAKQGPRAPWVDQNGYLLRQCRRAMPRGIR